jgi:cyclopropane fatty-acyl-phospholipid synthase-like methyltransferase
MEQEGLIALLVNLHLGLSRLGLGSSASTLMALALCADLPAEPAILDVGCGAGAQTLILASATDGHITAIDLVPAILAQLEAASLEQGLDKRIQPSRAT